MRVYQDFLVAQTKSNSARGTSDESANLDAKQELKAATVWIQSFASESCAQPNEDRYKVLMNDLAMYHAMRSEPSARKLQLRETYNATCS